MVDRYLLKSYFTKNWLYATIITLAIYYLSFHFGKLFALAEGDTIIWIPSGIALAAFFVFGTKIWISIFVGVMLFNIQNFIDFEKNILLTTLGLVGIASINTLQGLIGYYYTKLLTNNTDPLKNIYNTLIFIIFGAFFATLVNSLFGVALFSYFKDDWNSFFSTFLSWFLGGSAGILIFTPLFINLKKECILITNKVKLIEFISLILLLYFLINIFFTTGYFFPAALIIPYTLFLIMRFNKLGTSIMVLFIYFFSAILLKDTTIPNIFSIDYPDNPVIPFIFLTIIFSITSLFLSVIFTNDKNLKADLIEKNIELNKWNKITIDREKRTIELKNEVNDLLKLQGKEKKYFKN